MYDYENIINEIKDDYNRKLKNKELIINDYKTNTMRTQANNENLISYIVEQIQQLQNKFENYNSGIDFDDDYLLNNYSKITESDDKLELIHQNFVLLSHKLNEFKRNNILEMNKLKIKLEEEQNNKKQLLNNIDLQKMKKNSIVNTIADLKKIIEEKYAQMLLRQGRFPHFIVGNITLMPQRIQQQGTHREILLSPFHRLMTLHFRLVKPLFLGEQGKQILGRLIHLPNGEDFPVGVSVTMIKHRLRNYPFLSMISFVKNRKMTIAII